MGVTRRTCDRGGLCERIGNRCQMVKNYDLHEEAYACCCSGDLCNSAPSTSLKSALCLIFSVFAVKIAINVVS
uniref:Activin_recp domain-containing protein n=1 Tax=Steinernema glaseri TaxID=37863 RepID=A0A1I8ANE7_9BILA